MTRAVGIPWEAAKIASWGPRARAPGSEERDRTVNDHLSFCRYEAYIGGRHFQLLEGPSQLQGVQCSWLVILQELGPPAGVGRVVDGERCEHGNPDGIRDLITLPEPPVTAAEWQAL